MTEFDVLELFFLLFSYFINYFVLMLKRKKHSRKTQKITQLKIGSYSISIPIFAVKNQQNMMTCDSRRGIKVAHIWHNCVMKSQKKSFQYLALIFIDNLFHKYLMSYLFNASFSKCARNWNPTMAFWGKTKIEPD